MKHITTDANRMSLIFTGITDGGTRFKWRLMHHEVRNVRLRIKRVVNKRGEHQALTLTAEVQIPPRSRRASPPPRGDGEGRGRG